MRIARLDDAVEALQRRRAYIERTVLAFRRHEELLAEHRAERARGRGLRVEELEPVGELEVRRWRIYAADGELLGMKRTAVVFDDFGRYVGTVTEVAS